MTAKLSITATVTYVVDVEPLEAAGLRGLLDAATRSSLIPPAEAAQRALDFYDVDPTHLDVVVRNFIPASAVVVYDDVAPTQSLEERAAAVVARVGEFLAGTEEMGYTDTGEALALLQSIVGDLGDGR